MLKLFLKISLLSRVDQMFRVFAAFAGLLAVAAANTECVQRQHHVP
jgi:hypothetical protein